MSDGYSMSDYHDETEDDLCYVLNGAGECIGSNWEYGGACDEACEGSADGEVWTVVHIKTGEIRAKYQDTEALKLPKVPTVVPWGPGDIFEPFEPEED